MSENDSQKQPSSGVARAKLAIAAAFLLFSVSAGFVGGWLGSASRSQNKLTTSTQKEVVSSESQLISQIAKNVGPSVVSVNVTSQAALTPSVFGDLTGGGQQQSAGTGFIVSSDGVIVTNRHVVPVGTTSVSIVLSDGTKLDNVQVLGRTADSDPLDIAFLKVTDAKGHTLTPVTLGDSSKMQVGDKVIAIGNALGQFQNTVTSGIISGYGRDVQAGDASGSGNTESLQDLFQTDAAINEGNSGGPLVNLDGQVIGINTAVAGDAQNIGFAIPINNVGTLIKGVLSSGKLQRPYLGVRYISITDDLANQYQLPVKRGAYITPQPDSIVAGSPADKAGLQPGDIITKVEGTAIDARNDLATILGRDQVGQKVSVTVIRGTKTITLSAVLGDAPQN
jgi:serine protease Do